MPPTVLCAGIVLACALTFSTAQMICKGRCGAEYYRGYMCQCDYNCLSYGECCMDYESKCTTKNSCKGRCGEVFKRGRLCNCDSDCLKYNQCCSDYKSHCDAEESALDKGIEEPSPFSEGNNADDPLVSPTSYPQDDLSNDKSDQIFPNDPTPESTSAYVSTADLRDQVLLEQVPVDPTVELSTERVTTSSQTETTPSDNSDDGTTALSISSGEGATQSTDASDSIPSMNPGPTSAPAVSIQPSPTAALQTGPTAPAGTAELEGSGRAPKEDIVPETPATNPPEAASHEPEVTASPFSTAPHSSEPSVSEELAQEHTTLGTTLATTTFAPSTVDLTPGPESSASTPETDDASTGPYLSTSIAPAGPGSDILTTHAPYSSATVQRDSKDDITPQVTTATSPVSKPKPTEATSKPQKPDTHKPSPTKPAVVKFPTKPKPLDSNNPGAYQADDNDDTNLCSGRPVGAVTALRNGTIVVFRGHYFWLLDSNRAPGPAQSITQVWGVPSPVDTVFTRCSCQGKTYIFKGAQYWRFENEVLDPGYPKVIETGFDGLRGHIIAALSVPQYQNRKESVYFFKRGGSVQKYSYQLGTSPTCGKKVKFGIYTVRNRMARQAVSVLEAPITIHKSWRGFPSTITAAVSIPNNREPDGYKYYVFSRSKSYNVRMDGEHPVIAASNANRPPQSKDFFKCPKKV